MAHLQFHINKIPLFQLSLHEMAWELTEFWGICHYCVRPEETMSYSTLSLFPCVYVHVSLLLKVCRMDRTYTHITHKQTLGFCLISIFKWRVMIFSNTSPSNAKTSQINCTNSPSNWNFPLHLSLSLCRSTFCWWWLLPLLRFCFFSQM